MQWEREGETVAVAVWLLSVHLGSRFGFGFSSPCYFSSGMVEVGFEEGVVCHGEIKHVVCLMAETERDFGKFEWGEREVGDHQLLR